ncbi:hypothetical protein VTG60DRAFT_3523 [Thermothelomyces hinnuleus]
MPSKTGTKPGGASSRGEDNSNFVDDYLADWDDDPFRSPSPEPAKNDKATEKKTDVLGIEKELDLKRRPRAPRVKLDEARLLSDKGIPKLRKMAPRLKFKGKGHEFSDAARLLSFYQEWLDDLFPKATFLDALAMVEKTGHKTVMRNARLKWIDETKPRAATAEDDEDYRIHRGAADPRQPGRVAPIFDNAAKAAGERAKTPGGDNLFGDDDIYNATPVRSAASTEPSRQVVADDVPDGDDLDALMAEAEAEATARSQHTGSAPPFQSIFGNGTKNAGPAPGPLGEPDEDDLDALMAEAEAEAEAQSAPPQSTSTAIRKSIFGDGKPEQSTTPGIGQHDDNPHAHKPEAGTGTTVQESSQATGGEGATNGNAHSMKKIDNFDDEDDLDALMAEAEAEAGARTAAGTDAAPDPPGKTNNALPAPADAGPQTASFDEEEEAMAEMDGLW